MMWCEKARCYRLMKGDKIAVLDNTEKTTKQVAQEMKSVGIKVRIGKNPETNIWSIAILEDTTDEQIMRVSSLLR